MQRGEVCICFILIWFKLTIKGEADALVIDSEAALHETLHIDQQHQMMQD